MAREGAEELDRVIHDRARLSVLTSLISNAKGLTLGDMLIPSLFVRELVQDRTNRAADVIQDISRQVGGSKPSLDRLLLFPTPSRRGILVNRQSTGYICKLARNCKVRWEVSAPLRPQAPHRRELRNGTIGAASIVQTCSDPPTELPVGFFRSKSNL